MTELVQQFDSPLEITPIAERLRARALEQQLSPSEVIEILERWGESLRGPEIDAIPGAPFLRLWLRRSTLEPIIERELGAEALRGDWREEGPARLRIFPVGVVGHWPAGNIEIQPLLSMSCALLGGNACLVRIPSGLTAQIRTLMAPLRHVPGGDLLLDRLAMASFEHGRTDLQRRMAEAVDGAMIWGGAEAVTQVRALPFPAWARIVVFGPRLSVAAMDGQSWTDGPDRASWCRRLARDVWQFDQQACSSPQTLFLERSGAGELADFGAALSAAFEEENRLHPRQSIDPALSSAICLTRATWLLDQSARQAVFPPTPDWTLLLGSGAALPSPTQGRTLSVLVVDDLLEPLRKFDGMVQTLGLAVGDPAKEALLVKTAATHGVDRIVKIGHMHVFGSPWDGMDLVRPLVRIVRHVPASSQ